MSSCTGASASLDAAECAAWQAGFDAMGGTGWTYCSDKRADPCGCSDGWSASVTCSGGHITVVYLPNNQLSGSLPAEWSNMTQITEMYLNNN